VEAKALLMDSIGSSMNIALFKN